MAFTTYKTSGDEVPASYIQSLIDEVRPVSALKVGDQAVNNSATLVNDANLACAVAANAAYMYELHATYSSAVAAGLKINFTMPAGATMVRSNELTNAGSGTQHGPFTGASLGGITGTAADAAMDVVGYFTTSTTAGTFTLQWAQNTANVSNTVMRDGSFLVLRRLS